MIIWSTHEVEKKEKVHHSSVVNLSEKKPVIYLYWSELFFIKRLTWPWIEFQFLFFIVIIKHLNWLFSNSLMSRTWEFSLLCFSFSQLIRPINAIVNISLEHLYWYLKWSLHWMRSMHNIRQKRLVLPSVERRKSQCTFR